MAFLGENDENTVLAVTCRGLLATLTRRGIDTGEFLRRVGLSPAEFIGTETRLLRDAALRLWLEAYERTQCEALALEAAESLPHGSYGIYDHFFAVSPTFGAAVEALVRYGAMINRASRMSLECRGDAVFLHYDDTGFPAGKPRFAEEYNVATFLTRGRQAVGRSFRVASIEFTAPSPGSIHARHLREFFETEPTYGAPRLGFSIPRDLWEAPLAGAEAGSILFEALVTYAESLAKSEIRREAVDTAPAPTRAAPGVPSTTIHEPHLRAALARVHVREGRWGLAGLTDALRAQLATATPVPRITAGSRDILRIFDARDIERFYATNGYVGFVVDGEEHLHEGSLNALEERLSVHDFVRVHRAALINLRHIRALCCVSSGVEVELESGARVLVSRRRLPHLEQRLGLDV